MKVFYWLTLCFLGLLAVFIAALGIFAVYELMPSGRIPDMGPQRDYVIPTLIYTGIMILLTVIIGLALRMSFSEKK
ncbi:hypothetical protein GA0116948_103147 [Chitinophaga costaii]|uniref:Uncharacterized protein n=1 Tax=Chitinophaga costaii TaxID=1335309 RepID=A0A1C4BKL5_9BACT|nr:hypothetical protein [Chitinophaga costaii]PUZ27568.1 hypothetical protein DCM91_04910 [Chitinophaga costaii]SCC07481.1 hypothetical protein GA0116948_103147 [Chitinophaga costaii]